MVVKSFVEEKSEVMRCSGCCVVLFLFYTVELRCKNREAIPALQQFMLLTFPGARLEEEHGTRVKYCLPMKDFSLSLAFSALEREKDRLGLEDYNVSQSTLEQVFLSLANGRTQEEEE